MGLPGSAYYATDAQRFGVSTAHQCRPEWQVVDAARKAKAKHARALRGRFYAQRSEAMVAALQAKKELTAERRLDSLFGQRLRYNTNIALENHAQLRRFGDRAYDGLGNG